MSRDHATTGAPTRPSATPTTWNGRHWRSAVHRATGLSPAQKNLLFLLENEYCTWTSGDNVRPAESTIADTLGVSRQNVNHLIRKLREAGWVILTKPSTNRQPAHYRLGYGEHRPVQTQTQVAPTGPATPARRKPDLHLDANAGCVQTQTQVAQSQLLNPVSHLSLAPAPTAPAAVGRWEGEREEVDPIEQTNFDAFIRAFPNRKCRGGAARENAEDAYRDLTGAGIDHRTIMSNLRTNPPGPDQWPDKWLGDLTATATAQAKTNAAEARHAAIQDCDTCDDYGDVSGHYADGRSWAYKCKHGHDSRPAATGTDDAWAEPPW